MESTSLRADFNRELGLLAPLESAVYLLERARVQRGSDKCRQGRDRAMLEEGRQQ